MTHTQLAEHYVQLSDNPNKIVSLVNALPNEKCAILSASHAANDNIKDTLKQIRPDYNLDNITWLVYNQSSGWRDKTLFRDMHVYIHNSVLDDMSINHAKAINDVYGKVNPNKF